MRIFYVYILRCQGNRLYCGYTHDIKKRMYFHATTGTRFTKAFPPESIASYWNIYGTQGDAMRVEVLIKKQTRDMKNQLITGKLFLKTLLSHSGMDMVVKKGSRVQSLNRILQAKDEQQ